jgi:hypothetical protein
MKRPYKFLIVGVSAVTAILLLAGCTQKIETNSNQPRPSASATQTKEPQQPTSSVSPTQNTQVSSKSDEAKEAAQLFPNAHKTDHFTKEEVQLALLTANQYTQISSNTGYFQSGQFEKDGYPVEELQKYFKRYFLYTTWATFESSLKDKESVSSMKDGSTVPTYINSMRAMTYFVQLNGGTQKEWLPENCYTVGNPGDCTKGLPEYSKLDYAENSDGTKLVISQKVTLKQIFINDGTEGTQPVTLNYNLQITKNDPTVVDYKNDDRTMVIDEYSNYTEWGAWSAL